MIAAVTATYLLAGRPTGINYYRVTDGRTIQVGVVTGADTWTRIAVDETPSAVTATVYSYQLRGIALVLAFSPNLQSRSMNHSETGP